MIEQPTLAPSTERLRRAYGFEEVALVPGAITADPAEVDLSVEIGGLRLEIPFLAAAMDAVADAEFAVRMSRHGGVAFVNLEGLYTRYEDASPIIERVAAALDGQEAARHARRGRRGRRWPRSSRRAACGSRSGRGSS